MPALELTTQQQDAISTRDVSIALSAGAGCGKTFVLTQRFLSLLDVRSGIEGLLRIVAITFTDRAAREMRDRIREACREQLRSCADREASLWIDIIRGLDAARISTIHSFCTTLLRTYAVDAGLDPQFAVLEVNGSDALRRQQIARSVRRLLSEHDEDALLLVVEFGIERTREMLESLTRQGFAADTAAFAELGPADLQQRWIEHRDRTIVPQLLQSFQDSDLVREVVTFLRGNIPSHDHLAQCRAELLNELPRIAAADDPRDALARCRDCATVRKGPRAKAWDSEETYETVKVLYKNLRDEIDKLTRKLEALQGEIELSTGLALAAARLTNRILADYDRTKRRLGVLEFDDLLARTRDLLRAVPRVRQRAAAGIRFLMVDEFQDTDPVQAEIVRCLCGEDLLTGKLFLVGDAKQSIYRFRRADPRVFHRLRDEIPPTGRLPLSTNFRSQPEILKFVNCLFSDALGPNYEALHAFDERQLTPSPAVEFLFPTPDPNAEETGVEARRQIEADWIARRIAALLDGTPRVRTRDPATNETVLRPAQPGDVVLLFRSLGNVAFYEAALRDRGIEYYVVGGRAFYAQQEIFDLVNLCSYLDDPDDLIALAGVLRSPLFSLSDDTLFAMVETGRSLSRALETEPPDDLVPQQREQVRFAADVLNELRRVKDRLPVAALLERALERTGYDAALLNEYLGPRKLANLRKLLEMARQHDTSGLFTLKDFVVRLRNSVAEADDEELAATQAESSDVIRLMTIHQSKGLEFPIVFVADMDAGQGGGRSNATYHPTLGPLLPLPQLRGEKRTNPGHVMRSVEEESEEAAERLRLLYVATTRAADMLVLSACLETHGRFRSPWLHLLQSRFDLQTGLPAGDPYLGTVSLGTLSPEEIPEIRVHRSPPIPPDPDRTGSRRRALTEFHEAVAAASSGPLPPLLRPLSRDVAARRRFSVSELEQADAELRGADPARSSSGAQLELWSQSGSRHGELLGSLVHAALERIELTRPFNSEALANDLPAKLRGAERERLLTEAVATVESFLNTELARRIVSAPVLHRELEFLLRHDDPEQRNGFVTLTGTIDCLFESADGRWELIDYKTGASLAAKADEHLLEEYELQLGVYALALRQLLGREPDRIALAVLGHSPRLIEYRPNEEDLNALERRIDQAIAHLRGAKPQGV